MFQNFHILCHQIIILLHLYLTYVKGGNLPKFVNQASQLPNEKEAVYEDSDKWTAFQTEFPLIAAAKGLEILCRRNQRLLIIQVRN